MCRLRSEGPSYTKCGHYVPNKVHEKIDCGSRKCQKSDQHPANCPTCHSCEQHYAPDIENITAYIDAWCHLCEPWYGESARRRR